MNRRLLGFLRTILFSITNLSIFMLTMSPDQSYPRLFADIGAGVLTARFNSVQMKKTLHLHNLNWTSIKHSILYSASFNTISLFRITKRAKAMSPDRNLKASGATADSPNIIRKLGRVSVLLYISMRRLGGSMANI